MSIFKYVSLFKTIVRRLISISNEFHIDERVTIGEYTYGLSNANFLLFKSDDRVRIGRYCCFAQGVLIIASGEHNYRAVSNFPFDAHYLNNGVDKDTFSKGEIEIGNDVWVGARATILSGVKIGDGAVIAAGALVAKNVPPYAIVGGVPAGIIKYRFSEEVIESLLRISWWKWDPEFLGRNVDSFYCDVHAFLKKFKS